MRKSIYTITGIVFLILLKASFVVAQESPNKSDYQQVNTYVNPVLPGDHPDPTLLKVGDDFYHCGSSFHFLPFMPIYHSKDLVHWEVIGRVLAPSKAGFVSDRPSTGRGNNPGMQQQPAQPETLFEVAFDYFHIVNKGLK